MSHKHQFRVEMAYYLGTVDPIPLLAKRLGADGWELWNVLQGPTPSTAYVVFRSGHNAEDDDADA